MLYYLKIGLEKFKENTDTGFLEDPVYLINGTQGVIVALTEGRSLGWKDPRLLIHDSNDAGTGGFVKPTVSSTGTITGATLYTKGKYYSATTLNTAIVSEARDTTTAGDTLSPIGKDGQHQVTLGASSSTVKSTVNKWPSLPAGI